MHRDVLVWGDELESLLAAISAAQAGASVAVCRTAPPGKWLGGLSTRGGLAYMDLTWDMFSPLFQQFIQACGVKRVSLDPHTADQVLRQWLTTHQIPVFTVDQLPTFGDQQFSQPLADGSSLTASIGIDATPDADVAVHLGEPWLNGLHGLLDGLPGQSPLDKTRPAPQHIGVSPVFRLTGVDRHALMAFEADCRRAMTMGTLALALPWHPEAERATLLTRPCYSPDELDYVDILNPVLGIAFHQWWQGDVATYPHTRVWIDGGNVARLPDGSLSFNGMVTPAPDLPTLLHWSQQPVIPAFLTEAMAAFERFLQQAGGLTQARVVPPQQLYVRQTRHVLTRQVATAASLLAGGLPDATLGPYSYWLDTRGINLRQYVPGMPHFVKPQFNTHLHYTLCQRNRQLAVLGRAAGYGPLAQGTCRIVQHNAWLAEALGPAAALAALTQLPLAGDTSIADNHGAEQPTKHAVTHAGALALLQQEMDLINQAQKQALNSTARS
jgi:hypothetical protein